MLPTKFIVLLLTVTEKNILVFTALYLLIMASIFIPRSDLHFFKPLEIVSIFFSGLFILKNVEYNTIIFFRS